MLLVGAALLTAMVWKPAPPPRFRGLTGADVPRSQALPAAPVSPLAPCTPCSPFAPVSPRAPWTPWTCPRLSA